MAKIQIQIIIDENIKQQADVIFGRAGINISEAVTLFLCQSILQGGLPFDIEGAGYTQEIMKELDDAKRHSKNYGIGEYTNLDEIFKEWE